MDTRPQKQGGGGGRRSPWQKDSGRIQGTEVPYKHGGLRGSCQVPAALGCSLALLIGGGRARENISAAGSAWAHLHRGTL